MADRIEAVARAYCRRMGLDPDEDCLVDDGEFDVIWSGKQWQRYRPAASEAIAMQEAIADVMAAQKGDE